MPFYLRIEFNGVCAFVPNARRDRMTVLLINATEGEHAHGGAYRGPHLPPHYPFIRFNHVNFPNPNHQVLVNQVRALRFFDWEDLHIVRRTAPSNPILRIAGGRRPGSAEPAPGSTTEGRDFSWLAETAQIDPGFGEVDPACLRPDPPRNRVLGRVHLDDGEIHTLSLVETEPGNPILWQFRTIDGLITSPLCQVLAARVGYELRVDDADVTLRFTRFRGGAGGTVNLTLAPDANGEVKVHIENLPLEQALNLEGSLYDASDLRHHFALLYSVARRAPERIFIPHPVSHPDLRLGGLVRGGTTLCIGGTFTG